MRVHLVDGTYELFRAHFAPRPRRYDPSGRDVTATVGLVSSLLALLGEEVTHIAVAFDNPIESFRNELLDTYKSSEGVDPALLAQFDVAEEATAALGLTVWSMREFEADDALASAAARWGAAPEVTQVRILSPDKDLGQCVVGQRVVQVDRRRRRVYDEEGVRDRLGVAPASVPDLLALVGDRADGIPGLPGFGARTAAALLRRYPHLEDIPLDGRWEVEVRGADRLAATLATRFEDALLYRTLATLRRDVPLPDDPEAVRWHGVPRRRFLWWAAAFGAEELAARVPRWAEDDGDR